MKKQTTFTIKAGRRNTGLFSFRIIFRKEVSFYFKVSKAALYNYNMVINDWNRIIGLSVFSPLRSSCQLAFINNGYGLQCGFICWYNGLRTVNPVTHIIPGKTYHIKITCANRQYTITLTTEDGVDYKHVAPAKHTFPLQKMLLPRLGGCFSIDQNLVITLIK